MVTQAEPLTRQAKSGLIAPWWHFLGMLVILLAFVWCTFGWQSHSLAAGEPHQGNALHYLLIIASEWAMALYIWLGGFIPGATRLRDLIGGRWNSRGQFFRDIAIAAVFWVVFVAAAYLAAFVLKPRQVGNLEFVNPLGAIEVTLWVIMSMTAGFCEELVFRGYLQKQFLAFTGRATLAVLAQAILFGFRIGEISCPTRYFKEASSINFKRSMKYGLGVLSTTASFTAHKMGLIHAAKFEASGRKVTQHYYSDITHGS